MEADKHMDDLIKKFWDGETTLEEEKLVNEYFASNEVDNNHVPFQGYFDFIQQEKNQTLPSDFNVPESEPNIEIKSQAKVFNLRSVIRVAATLLILVGFFWIYQINQPKAEDTFENPELAYEQAVAALYFLSDKFEKGTESTASQLKQLEKLNIFN